MLKASERDQAQKGYGDEKKGERLGFGSKEIRRFIKTSVADARNLPFTDSFFQKCM